jgi:hypothetical protein
MSFITALVTGKVAVAALALGAVATGGTVAAFAGVLPSSAQSVAHAVIGAPSTASDDSPVPADAATPTPDPTSTPSPTAIPTNPPATQGPDASGPAAFGLCTAFSHGGLSVNSTAFASLLAAAGSAGIAPYCAAILTPGTSSGAASSSSHSGTKPVHPTHPVHPVTGSHKPVKPVKP